MRLRHAQTNVQLYAQLLELGWPEAELVRVRAAYGLAMRLHVARFRPCGRPFLAQYGGARLERLAYAADATPGLAALARWLGHDALARTFEEVEAACRDARIPESLCTDHAFCFDVLPPSVVRRPRAAWNHARPWRAWQLERARRWLHRLAARVQAER